MDYDLFISVYLGKQLRITLSDSRVILGKLVCLDNSQNFALKQSEELVIGIQNDTNLK